MSRRRKLDTTVAVAKEMAKIYNQARDGDLDLADATRFAQILAAQRQILEVSNVEAKLEELERVVLAKNVTPLVRRIT